jgi:putative nucleotidyltransferase with HDIG domain
MKDEPTLRRLLFSIATLEELGDVLGSQEEFRDNLRMSLYSVMGSLPVSKGALFLYRPRERKLVLEASRGISLVGSPTVEITDAMAESLRRRRKAVVLREKPARLSPILRRMEKVLDAIRAEIIMPLKFRDDLIGLIALGVKFTGETFTAEDMDLLCVMSNYIAIAIHNQELFTNLEMSNKALKKKATQNRRLYRNLESVYHDTIKALGAAIDAKDPYTRGHSDRVASFSEAIARRLGLTVKEVTAVRIASHLHDIGKIAIDNSILLKPGRLDDMEMDQIYRHPTVSFDILSNIKFPYPDVALIARHHHEWVNGEGYPDRIHLEDLNDGMKILSLADAFDAMTSDRPYRPALDLELVLNEVRGNVNRQFDRRVTRAFFGVLGDEIESSNGGAVILPRIRSRYTEKAVRRIIGEVRKELTVGRISAPGPLSS